MKQMKQIYKTVIVPENVPDGAYFTATVRGRKIEGLVKNNKRHNIFQLQLCYFDRSDDTSGSEFGYNGSLYIDYDDLNDFLKEADRVKLVVQSEPPAGFVRPVDPSGLSGLAYFTAEVDGKEVDGLMCAEKGKVPLLLQNKFGLQNGEDCAFQPFQTKHIPLQGRWLARVKNLRFPKAPKGFVLGGKPHVSIGEYHVTFRKGHIIVRDIPVKNQVVRQLASKII